MGLIFHTFNFTLIFYFLAFYFFLTLHSSLFRIHSVVASTAGDATKITRNSSLFTAMNSTSDPDREESHQQILLFAFSSLDDPDLYISWTTYQSPSSAPPITTFFAIVRTENDELQLQLLSCTQTNGDNPRATVSFLGLLVFTRTSNLMPPSIFRVNNINFSNTVFSKPISYLFSIRLSIEISNKQSLLTHFGGTNFDAMFGIIPFHVHFTDIFVSPKRTCISCSNCALPLCWPFPNHHTITLADKIPLP